MENCTNILTCNRVKTTCVFISQLNSEAENKNKFYCLNLASPCDCTNCKYYISKELIPDIINEIDNYQAILSGIKERLAVK